MNPREQASSWLFVLAAVASGAVLWIPEHPPMIDLPQHVSQLEMMLLWNDPDWRWRELFELNLFTPYLFGYGVAWIVGQVLPVNDAIKLVFAGSAIAFPLSFSWFRRRIDGDPIWDWLVLALGYGFSFRWGLLSFSVGAPLVFPYLALVRRYLDDTSTMVGNALALASVGMFFVHMLLAAYVCLIGVVWSLADARDLRTVARRWWPYAVPVPFVLAWMRATRRSAEYAGEATQWNGGIQRILEVFGLQIGGELVLAYVFVGIALYALPLLAGAQVSRDARRWLPAVVALLFFLACPDVAFGNRLTARRFAMFGLPLFLIALEPVPAKGALQSLARAAMIVLPLGIVGELGLRFSKWHAESADFREMLPVMPSERRVLYLVYDRFSDSFDVPAFLSMGQWYVPGTGGHVDFSYAALYPQVVRYRSDTLPPLSPNRFTATLFDWYEHEGWTYDYLLVYRRAGPPELEGGCAISLSESIGDWHLFEQDAACVQRHRERE